MAVRLDQYQRITEAAFPRKWRPLLDRRTKSWSTDAGRTWVGWSPSYIPADAGFLYTRRHGLIVLINNVAYRSNRNGSLTQLGLWPVEDPRPPLAGTDDGFIHVSVDYTANTAKTVWMDDRLQVTEVLYSTIPAPGVIPQAGLVLVRGDTVMVFDGSNTAISASDGEWATPALVSTNRGASWITYNPVVHWHRWESWGHNIYPDIMALWGNTMRLWPLYGDQAGVVCLNTGFHQAWKTSEPGADGIITDLRVWQGELARLRWADGGVDRLQVLYNVRFERVSSETVEASSSGTIVAWDNLRRVEGEVLAGVGIAHEDFWNLGLFPYSGNGVNTTPFKVRLEGTVAGGFVETPLDPALVTRLGGGQQPYLTAGPGLLWARRLHPEVAASQIWWRPGEAPFIPAPPPDWRNIVPLNAY